MDSSCAIPTNGSNKSRSSKRSCSSNHNLHRGSDPLDVAAPSLLLQEEEKEEEEEEDKKKRNTTMSECRNFLEQVLRPDLSAASIAVQRVQSEIQDYAELIVTLTQQQQQSKNNHNNNNNKNNDSEKDLEDEDSVMVDLGYGRLFCRAKFTPSVVDLNHHHHHHHDSSSRKIEEESKTTRGISKCSNYVFVHVGMGFHVELCTVQQEEGRTRKSRNQPLSAMDFCRARIRYLETVLAYRHEQLQKLERHVNATESILSQLASCV